MFLIRVLRIRRQPCFIYNRNLVRKSWCSWCVWWYRYIIFYQSKWFRDSENQQEAIKSISTSDKLDCVGWFWCTEILFVSVLTVPTLHELYIKHVMNFSFLLMWSLFCCLRFFFYQGWHSFSLMVIEMFPGVASLSLHLMVPSSILRLVRIQVPLSILHRPHIMD